MTLKSKQKSTNSKRSSPPRSADYTRTFLKDWERLSRSGRYDLNKLKEVILLLVANNGALPAEWLDHELTGNWENFRECHSGGDFLLIYKLDTRTKPETVIFTRTGTHSDLFE